MSIRHSDAIIEQLKHVCGLDAKLSQEEMPIGAKVASSANGENTLFSVTEDGATQVFELAGNIEQMRVVALLGREFAAGVIKSSTVEPVRAYLEGTGGVPHGVHVGKADYYVFAVHSESGRNSVREYLAAMSSHNDFIADMGDNITAFCKCITSDDDYQSAGEFAAVLRENIEEEMKDRIKIGIGGVAHGASELPKYYSYARSALVSGAEYDPQNDIYSYKEYALIKSLSYLSSSEKENYVKTVLDKNYREVLADTELMTAAETFLKHSLNISEASRSMYVHRNTLIYRLDKIEKLTGLNIRNFSDAMTFRVAWLINKMI